MIGSGAVALGIAAAVALIPLLGGGGPDPTATRGGRALIEGRAETAVRALERLEGELAPGVEAARRGAGVVVAGRGAPGEDLAAAAREIAAATSAERAAHGALEALHRARIALDPDATQMSIGIVPGELSSIAAQLEGTVAAADDFAEMRRRAEGVATRLDRALAALAANDLDAAETHVGAARADLDSVEAWDVDFATLPVWIETTDATVGAVERILASTRAGDADAAARAADDFAARRDEAATADRALRIAMGEGGSAVTAAPLGRLADVLRRLQSARAQVASIVHTVGR